MKAFVIVVVGLVAGCSSSEVAQQNLIAQLDHGLETVQQSNADRQQLLDSLYAQQRRQLDAAFDADVLNAAALDAQWVIEHRQAYALALDGMWERQLASQMANARSADNLQVIREGLLKLRWMSELRQKWSDTATQLQKEASNEQR